MTNRPVGWFTISTPKDASRARAFARIFDFGGIISLDFFDEKKTAIFKAMAVYFCIFFTDKGTLRSAGQEFIMQEAWSKFLAAI